MKLGEIAPLISGEGVGKSTFDAGVAELVDALGLGPSAYGVGVRVPSPAPTPLEIYCKHDVLGDAYVSLYLDVLRWVGGLHLPAEVCCGDVAGVAATPQNITCNPELYPK